ncbi:MAG: Sua5 YciO YrdC YwlC family protein [Helicobacter sp.]|nr:Sua5 YciO YrdC YwlC family protein [Helicobacter sp.]MBD5167797.1 Sua5 YciO YrdC YwlC family protein [Helicobacter sp.]
MLYLAQTDTTAGFLAHDAREIAHAKQREERKPCVWTTARLAHLREVVRVPRKFAARVRRSRRCTFIVRNRAVRLVADCPHAGFLGRFDGLFSSSANKSGESFCADFALRTAKICVFERDNPLCERAASRIYRLNNHAIKRIR